MISLFPLCQQVRKPQELKNVFLEAGVLCYTSHQVLRKCVGKESTQKTGERDRQTDRGLYIWGGRCKPGMVAL